MFSDASFNSLMVLRAEFGVFKNLKHLRVLDLGNNGVSHLAGNPFEDLVSLEYLYVHLLIEVELTVSQQSERTPFNITA
jgi:hypothetical protein